MHGCQDTAKGHVNVGGGWIDTHCLSLFRVSSDHGSVMAEEGTRHANALKKKQKMLLGIYVILYIIGSPVGPSTCKKNAGNFEKKSKSL